MSYGTLQLFLSNDGGIIKMNEIEHLYNTIKERKERKEEGSYTSYLFNKGTAKILKKVGEECTEVVIASLSQSKQEQIEELSDLHYHLLVLMVQQGITLQDIEHELEKRSQKTHNLKAERKPIEKL